MNPHFNIPFRLCSSTLVLILVALSPTVLHAQNRATTPTAPAADSVRDLPLSDEARQRFVGSYSITTPDSEGPAMLLRLFSNGDALFGQIGGNDPTRMLYQGGDVFRPEAAPDFVITFTLDGDRATRLAMASPEGAMEGTRVVEPSHADPGTPFSDATSGALFDELARLDSALFHAAYVSCDARAVNALLTRDVEFYHDRTGFHAGAQVREDFRRLARNCPRDQGVSRQLIPGALRAYPIANYGAVQTGDHRFVERGEVTATVAKFVTLWQREGSTWKVARVLSFDHRSEAASSRSGRTDIGSVVDSIAIESLRDGLVAGLSIAVVRGEDTLVLNGYGHANVELNVPTPGRAVYQIGSLTKQFTAVAMLQLVDQGSVSLDDEITRYLPDYPTQGHRITVRQLLNHTSGIRDHVDLPEFWRIAPLRLPSDSLVALFAAKPLDFTPGEAMRYNSSGYFLASLIIERVTGMPYAAYVRDYLFRPAGMPDSHYCSNSAVVKNRASGYSVHDGRLERAQYLDLAWPYSGGALCSTAEDLVAWNRALHSDQLLSAASYRDLTTPATLHNGTQVPYGLGLAVDSMSGRRVFSHGGSIPGFLSHMEYFPEDELTIVVLINSDGPVRPQDVVRSIRDRITVDANL